MISIQNLHFSYQKKKVFNGLSLSFWPGHIYGLLGKNGTGKSTLLKNIAGSLFPGKGSIDVMGFAPGKRQPAFLQDVFIVPEEFYLPDVKIEKFIATGAIFASTTFAMLGRKDKGIYWISFPASHLEKLLAVLFFNVIAFTLAYTLCFFLLKTITQFFIQIRIDNEPLKYRYNRMSWSNENGLGAAVPYFLMGFFVVQAAYILGSASFKKFSFIITTIITAALVFLFILYVAKLGKGSFNGYSFNLFDLKEYKESGVYKEYIISPLLKEPILFFLKFLTAPFLWLTTWFKLKEKQI